MKPPIDNYFGVKRGYKFGQPTSYNNRHIGIDLIVPVGTPCYAVADGNITLSYTGPKGGNIVEYKVGSLIFRYLHLSRRMEMGAYKEGDVIGFTGNTGTQTTGPHLHFDISHRRVDISNFQNFCDPDAYFLKLDKKPVYTLKVLAVNADPNVLMKTREHILWYSDGFIDVNFETAIVEPFYSQSEILTNEETLKFLDILPFTASCVCLFYERAKDDKYRYIWARTGSIYDGRMIIAAHKNQPAEGIRFEIAHAVGKTAQDQGFSVSSAGDDGYSAPEGLLKIKLLEVIPYLPLMREGIVAQKMKYTRFVRIKDTSPVFGVRDNGFADWMYDEQTFTAMGGVWAGVETIKKDEFGRLRQGDTVIVKSKYPFDVTKL